MATVSPDCSQTTLTILSGALLAVVAWYTPVATSNSLQRLAAGPDWNYAYQQLWKGIASPRVVVQPAWSLRQVHLQLDSTGFHQRLRNVGLDPDVKQILSCWHHSKEH